MEKQKTKTTKAPPVDLVEEARQLRLMADDLERRLLTARGTQRIEKTAPPPVQAVEPAAPVNYHVGDSGTTDELTEVVRDLLSQRPMYFREIVETTGARANRIKGVIVRLQREGHKVIDVSPEGSLKALWFIPSEEVLERLLTLAQARAR